MSARGMLTGLLATCVLLALALAPGSPASPSAGLPASGRIVFATDDGMASINPDGSGAWGLRFTRIGHDAPAWAPDGSAIAFVDQDRLGILAMDPDGTSVRMLAPHAGAGNPAWSPDGRVVAFDDGARIFAVEVVGGREVPMAFGAWPTWSPDGAAIAFESGGDILALELATGAVRQLTSGPAYDAEPAWSPDGTQVLFTSDRGGSGLGLYAVRADGADVRRISQGDVFDAQPAWSPDGTRIAFMRNGQVWTSAADGSGAGRLVYGNGWSLSPSWQPLPVRPVGCTFVGTPANDLLVGSERGETFCGGDGDDTLVGLGGHDALRGGDGNDWIAGGLGRDSLVGGPGADRLDARDGEPDRIDGGSDRDNVLVDGFLGVTADSARRAERVTLSTNVSAWRPTTASNEEATNPSEMAVDGRIDDYWSSGGYPTQWLEIDLGRPTRITSVRLIAPDLAKGVPVLLLGRSGSPTSAYRLLHRFEGPAVFKQELRFAPRRPWRGVQVVRLQVPQSQAPMGWVSWPEIEVHSRAS